ncbi:hypothetical protein ACH4SP_01000 [Streptomyces sp. NPDC021093]|uniref:hypothetical protein n=1 Tax=Streptomyces sp. NPDC021093 TaxID=3365112 RepID=UPI0037B240EE
MAQTNRPDENRPPRPGENPSGRNPSGENRSPAFGPTAYDVLGLEIGADAKAVRAARLKGMADPKTRSGVSRAANSLTRPSGRLGAALLTPLLGSLSEEELKCRVSDAARELLAGLPPLLPEADRFGPFPRSDA